MKVPESLNIGGNMATVICPHCNRIFDLSGEIVDARKIFAKWKTYAISERGLKTLQAINQVNRTIPGLGMDFITKLFQK